MVNTVLYIILEIYAKLFRAACSINESYFTELTVARPFSSAWSSDSKSCFIAAESPSFCLPYYSFGFDSHRWFVTASLTHEETRDFNESATRSKSSLPVTFYVCVHQDARGVETRKQLDVFRVSVLKILNGSPNDKFARLSRPLITSSDVLPNL